MTGAPRADDPRSMTERMRAGELYVADDPEIFEAADAAIDLMGAYNATTPRQEPLRRLLLSQLLEAIGEDTGAGAVVTRDLPAGVVAVGNPARVIKHLDSPAGGRGESGLDVRPGAEGGR